MSKILTETPKIRYYEDKPECDPVAFKKVIQARRSVRVFKDEPIPDHIVYDCLDSALLAPNSSNLQPWKFLRIVNPELKKKLHKACMNQLAARTSAELIVCIADPKAYKQHSKEMIEVVRVASQKAGIEMPSAAVEYYGKLAPLIYNQGCFGIRGRIKKVLFWFAGFFTAVPREPHSHADMKLWASKTCALACENLMLAFSSHNYDTCPMEGFDSHQAWKHLNQYMLFDGKPYNIFSYIKHKWNRWTSGQSIVMIVSAGKRSDTGVFGPRIRYDKDRFITEV